MTNRLEIFSASLEESVKKRKKDEEEFFTKNPPLKEFSVIREGEEVVYGVWKQNDEELKVIFKTSDGKYHHKNKTFYDIKTILILSELVQELF